MRKKVSDQSERSKLAQGTKLLSQIVLIGDGGVGKTTLSRAWLGEGTMLERQMDIGVNFGFKDIIIDYSPTNRSYNFRFRILDLAGHPRFKAVRDLYYRGAFGALCFFDITNQESYENLNEWVKAFWTLNGRGTMPVIIVGAKCDLRGNPAFPFQIAAEIGEAYAAELSAMVFPKHGFKIHYIETSAKANINVDKPFRLLAYEIISAYDFQEKIRK